MPINIELPETDYLEDNDSQFVAATVLEGISSLNEFKQSYELGENHDPNLKILLEKFASVDNYQQTLIQQLCSQNNHPAFA